MVTDPKHLLGDNLEEEIGYSTEAVSKGVIVILDKVEKGFGKEEDIELMPLGVRGWVLGHALLCYKVLEGKSRNNSAVKTYYCGRRSCSQLATTLVDLHFPPYFLHFFSSSPYINLF